MLQVYSTLKDPASAPEDWGMVLVAWVVAAVTAFVTVKWLLRFVQTHTFEGFGWYRIALGIGAAAARAVSGTARSRRSGVDAAGGL